MHGSQLNRISIRLRLTVWYAVALMLGLALFGFVMWLAAEQRLLAGVDTRLAQRLAGLESALKAESRIKSRAHLQRELAEIINGYPDGSLIQLRDAAGDFLLNSGPAPAGIRPEWYFLAPFYTLKLIPSHVWRIEGELLGLMGFALLAAWWVLLPSISNTPTVRRSIVYSSELAVPRRKTCPSETCPVA